MALLDNWRILKSDQISLLALPADTKPRQLQRYHQITPLPYTSETNGRMEHLVGIADALRTSYPHNPDYGTRWMNRCNDRFENRTSLAVTLENGLAGLISIRTHLDCS